MPEGFLLVLSGLGSQAALSGYIALYYWWTGNSVRRLVLLMGTTLALNVALKAYFDFPRPAGYDGLTALGTQSASFPSGHAQAAGSFFTYWGLKRGGWVWTVAMVLALLISYSRIALGVHYPRDVLAGLVIGAVLAFPFARFSPLSYFQPAIYAALALLLVGALIWPSLAAALGIIAAALFARPSWSPPAKNRVRFCGLGLVLTLVMGAILCWLLDFSGPAQFLLSGLLVTWALTVWPWLYRRIFV